MCYAGTNENRAAEQWQFIEMIKQVADTLARCDNYSFQVKAPQIWVPLKSVRNTNLTNLAYVRTVFC